MKIYCVTNNTNGKKYIGQTIREVEDRWNSHCSAARNGSPFRFHSAIRKYGEDNFTVEVLFDDLTEEYGRTIEEQLIYEFNTMDRDIGYNAKPGGCGGWIVKPQNYDGWLKKITESSFKENNSRWSGYDDNFIIKKCVEIFNSYSDKNDFSFRGILRELNETYKGIPKSFSKNRFISYVGDTPFKRFKVGLSQALGIPVEQLMIYSSAKSEKHRASLSKYNTGIRWYSNKELKISKPFKNEPIPEGWVKGKLYDVKN